MELYGLTLTTHLDTIFAELRAQSSIYGYPLAQLYRPDPELDLSVQFQGKRAATPLGPASGPHTQMAQNLVLAFLGGCRVMELKTVQIRDELEIPRPCIDARTVGYNVEWSQELKLEASYHEYVTAWVLLKILEHEEVLGYPKGDPFYDTVFDLSVGYDLKGIRSLRVSNWIKSMMSAERYISDLLAELPPRYARFRQLAIDPRIASSLTLSTFHGCPRDEIDGIVRYLVGELGLDVYVKMNPTQLGFDWVNETLIKTLGYTHVQLERKAFEEDLAFEDGVVMMRGLLDFAKTLGRRMGAKFTNTLVVRNNDTFFTDEVMYLSGTPLHVLSMNAMLRFREAMGADFPVSFSAGIDQSNFTDAVCFDMKPVTTCTDLLQKGGYTRAPKYLNALAKAMRAAAVRDLDGLIRHRAGNGELSVAEAGLANARRLVPELALQSKYHYNQNRKPPKKVGTFLETFNCLTCNICLPVCPNAANFSLPIAPGQHSYPRLRWNGFELVVDGHELLELSKPAQIANLADFCNECANCEVFCPELGGPQKAKPRFFSGPSSFAEASGYDGYYFKDADTMVGRFAGQEHSLRRATCSGHWTYHSPLFGEVSFDENFRLTGERIDPSLSPDSRLELAPAVIMKTLWSGVLASNDYAATLLRGEA